MWLDFPVTSKHILHECPHAERHMAAGGCWKNKSEACKNVSVPKGTMSACVPSKAQPWTSTGKHFSYGVNLQLCPQFDHTFKATVEPAGEAQPKQINMSINLYGHDALLQLRYLRTTRGNKFIKKQSSVLGGDWSSMASIHYANLATKLSLSSNTLILKN